MTTTYSIKETARQLGVAEVTVYQWIGRDKIQVIETRQGSRPRYRITGEEIERMREHLYGIRADDKLVKLRPGSIEQRWVTSYRSALGCKPIMLGKYLVGLCTFDQMREAAESAFRGIMEI